MSNLAEEITQLVDDLMQEAMPYGPHRCWVCRKGNRFDVVTYEHTEMPNDLTYCFAVNPPTWLLLVDPFSPYRGHYDA